jgi:RNA polymerase sigma factor (sigma-70 family)
MSPGGVHNVVVSEYGRTQLRVVEDNPPSPAVDWETIYRREVDGVYRFIFTRTGNRADTEDICAQVFLRALPRLRSGAHPGEIHGYLLATARSLLADFWSERFGHPSAELVEEILPTPAAVEVTDHSGQVTALLNRLPDRDRRVLELRFLRGYSIKETAAALGVTVANCKVIQLRALRRAAGLGEDGP